MIVHEIVTNEPLPIRLHHYRCPIAWHDQFVHELDFLKEKNFIAPSTSPWAAPMFAVPKKTGDIRLIVDYRRLNNVTVPDPCVMPRIEVLLEMMGKANIYSKLDLKKGYYQVPVAPHHQDKTAFVTEWGKFKLTVMPFGLRNAPSTFQRLMDVVLHRCYIDDISIFSQNWTDHLLHICEVLSKLERAGLTLQLKKCTFGSDYCEFLGHQVGAGKISPQTAKTEAVANYQQPRTKTDIRSFIGLAGYYRRYIPNFSAIAAPLSDCTKTSASEKIEWTEDCKKACESLKNVLTSKSALVPPNYSNQFILHTDASNRGIIGAVLSQGNPKEDNAIGYFSRKLLSREKNYLATEKEGLAVVAACKHFLPYLLGRHFTIVTDHRALEFLTSNK